MKKLLKIMSMTLVLTCLLITSSVFAVDLEEKEPNNTLDTATRMRLHGTDGGEWKRGYITAKDPSVDYYQFRYDKVENGGEIDVMLSGIPQGCDYDVALLNQNGQVIAKSDTTYCQEEIHVKNSPSGRYYIKVYSYRGTSSLPYEISVY